MLAQNITDIGDAIVYEDVTNVQVAVEHTLTMHMGNTSQQIVAHSSNWLNAVRLFPATA